MTDEERLAQVRDELAGFRKRFPEWQESVGEFLLRLLDAREAERDAARAQVAALRPR